ncbi:MAG: phenyltransferase domain-containing protein [Desulfobacterales bacterium]|nr:phenyltransferase domain-containing protein [Desulfobacterales bacterium]MCP4158846.1 phenyltransferase domain-containing protein [Deltaproteobacteria bacterium]
MDFKKNLKLKGKTFNIKKVADAIVYAQKENGEIQWCAGEKTDPWDLIEAVMGLSVAGYFNEARKAFEWMEQNQLDDGSWYASYLDGIPQDKTHDTNMTTYIASGVYHHYLITKDMDFLVRLWPVVEKAIEFALTLQTEEGEIYWAKSPEGVVDKMSLLTGSSSVFFSLKCAVAIANELGHKKNNWKQALLNLKSSLNNRIFAYNISKSRFSMDWFYPVLSGAITGVDAQNRINKYWKKFIVDGMGARCVSDEPWITIAETAELVLALRAMGRKGTAEIIFSWIVDRTYDDDGSYWCGFTFPNMLIWPESKLSWTNGVMLLAADSLYNITDAHRFFHHDFWDIDKLTLGI